MKVLFTLFSSFAMIGLLFGNSHDASVDAILTDPALKPYHGWVRYLNYRLETAGNEDAAAEWGDKLENWIERINENPDVINDLEGAFEWAYESQVDLSGQPFKMAVPLNYDPAQSYGISLYMHGYSGNHMEHATGMESSEENFNLSILGRARGGQYQNLSEADVIDVLEYVQENWNIDPQRIHFSGGSMGGWATFNLSNRYPHLVASARPTCGFGANLPLGNWKHIPFYSIHSKDDYTVPVTMSRIPLQGLQRLGGKVIIDETDGYGHASWDYAEGNARGDAWYGSHRAPSLKEVYEIDYTALDKKARRGYWAEVEEWGYEQAPARFQLAVDKSNELYATLTNVGVLKVELGKGPFDLQQELMLSINGQIPQYLPSPLPETIYIQKTEQGFTAQTEAPAMPDFHLRFPGSARNLYAGEPLLIVWGTQGTDEENDRIANAALAARRSAHPTWTADDGQLGPDGTVHEHNTYGLLAGKPDTEVTEEDIQRCHLVLIGSARQNLIAARIADQLPLSIRSDEVVANDGIRWFIDNPASLITYYNPLAPQNLIFWIACESADFYKPGNALIQRAYRSSLGISRGTDVVLFDWDSQQMIASRNFDSRWQWKPEYGLSPLVPEQCVSFEGLADLEAKIAIDAVGADFAIVGWPDIDGHARLTRGQTRMTDLLYLYYRDELVVMEMSGAEVLRYKNACEAIDDDQERFAIKGEALKNNIQLGTTYRVVANINLFWSIMGSVETVPDNFRYSGVFMREAFQLYLDRNF